jgi:hypothetical protein
MTLRAAYQIDFTEVEPGWGQRPDGSMLFPSKESADAYAIQYRDKERERMKTSPCPDYSYPGTPRLVEITIEQSDRLEAEGPYWIKL